MAIQLDEALRRPGSEYDITLQEGDVLDIPLVRNTVRVFGAVMHPAVLTFEKNKDVKAYIEDCGGYTKRARKSKAYVVHMNGRSERMSKISQVMPGDDVVIPEKNQRESGISDSAFMRGAEAITAIAAMGQSVAYILLVIDRTK